MIKVELEEDEPKEGTRITLAMITAVILTLITQLLFTKCKKRYSSERTTRTEVEEILEDESEEEFEIISNHEEDQEVIQNQDVQQEEAEVERPTEVVREEHEPPPQEIQDEGRKIYMTKSGEKYHLSQGCDTLREYRSYERKACEVCRQRTEQILTISTYGSPPQSETELTFVHENEVYHDKDCVRMRNTRRKGSRPICLVCESEERTLLYASNRAQTGRN